MDVLRSWLLTAETGQERGSGLLRQRVATRYTVTSEQVRAVAASVAVPQHVAGVPQQLGSCWGSP